MADGNPGPTPEEWLYSPWQRRMDADILVLARAINSEYIDNTELEEIIARRTAQEGQER